MSELRQDPVTGRWVVIAPTRILRPGAFFPRGIATEEPEPDSECPFCPGNEGMTPPEVYAVRCADTQPDAPGWRVRVVPNRYPAFGEKEGKPVLSDFFRGRPAPGVHEVIIHAPDHYLGFEGMELDEIVTVLKVVRDRCLNASLRDDVKYVHVIGNQGRGSGASILHPHSQLFGLPLVPASIQSELAGSMWYHDKKSICVFCRMMEEEKRLGERIVFDNTGFAVIAPFASRFPYEVWIVPSRHQPLLTDVWHEELTPLGSVLRKVAMAYKKQFGHTPYNYYFHQAPSDGLKYPFYHWHIEMFPRLTELGGFEFGTEMMINPVRPEDVTSILRLLE